MKTIGFANKYYTLWEVSEPYRVQISKYEYREKQDFTYIQNLAMDIETAKQKLKGEFEIDLSLKGSSTFTKTSEIINDCPDHIFKFGKYSGEDIVETNDIEYTSWYYSETSNPIAKKLLLDNDYVEYDGSLMTQDAYDELKENKEKLDFIDSLEKGHFFSNGDKVEISIMEIDEFSFSGTYGTTHVITYASKCGKLLKYMGSSPPKVSAEDYVKVLTAVKHAEYNGVDETKVSRVKVL